MALPITVYGSRTCEDTALVRDRLRALDIQFVERDKEDVAGGTAVADVQALLKQYGHGSPRTPTVVFGKDATVLIEPSVEALDDALAKAGYATTGLNVVQFGSVFSARVAPEISLASTRSERFDLNTLRGWRRSVLFFAHDSACRVCQGLARQLANRKAEFEDAEARLVLVLQGDKAAAHRWTEEFAANAETLADTDGTVKRRYVEYFSPALDAHANGTMLFILDKYTAPRVGSAAHDAGGLVSPQEVASWLHLLESECDE